jgi:transcription elongation factor Elf1
MSYYLEEKYLNEISTSLRNFKKKKPGLWNFSCPYCGDSKKKRTKARGYAVKTELGYLFFKCHNCGRSAPFSEFLKFVDFSSYSRFMLEKMEDRGAVAVHYPPSSPPVFATAPSKKKLSIPSISELSEKHFARQWCSDRRIPEKFWDRLFFAEDFKDFVLKDFGQDYINSLYNGDMRLVIPFYDEFENIFMLQGRTLGNSKLRYISLKFDKARKKIFGLERLNPDSIVYVVEGPIDSLFLDNSIAIAGAELGSVLYKYQHPIFIFDNEPQNKEVVAMMNKVIQAGKEIVIWPRHIKQKDINDMVLDNIDVEKEIRENTFSGLDAQARFMFWKGRFQ